ncbi:muscle M-line assembly protein unc-89-like [Contarinia nasturtii]|uniref:muscle M-line assembly protein unc-89-like n=1 Tax=Contarinia nasturtii TaxID=265458 RepID=UPI0012D3D150|nr:muscle M-line assembly protein unc-89-like [Contarinia nasturtii]
MPSRNKKNRNRAQPTSGASATTTATTKNEASVKINEDSGPTNVTPQETDLKCTITEAKEKLDQLQQSVDTIKASIVQTKSDESHAKKPDVDQHTPIAINEEKSEEPFESQTMKKKRNRNRNRNRNKNHQGATDTESGVSSTSGTNENSTHENSPAPASLSATILSISEVITSEIKEEPKQIECKDAKPDKLDLVCASETNVETSAPPEPIGIVDISKIPEIKSDKKIDENILKLIESEKSDVKIDEPAKKKNDEKMIASTLKSVENEQNDREIEVALEKCEESVKKCDSKDSEKQTKNRQAKNTANKNQKPSPVVEDQMKTGGNKGEANVQLVDKNDKIDKKDNLMEAESKSSSKNSKENKKSPKPNKKNQTNENKSTEVVVQQKPIEPNVLDNEAEKRNDDCECIPIEKIDETKIQSEQTKVDQSLKISGESVKTEEKLQQIPLPCEKNQIENIPKGTKPEMQEQIKQETNKADVNQTKHANEPKIKKEKEMKEDSKPEIKHEIKSETENKEKTKQQPSEAKPTQSVSPKESKKSKGKKPQQTKPQNDQKPEDESSGNTAPPEYKSDIKSTPIEVEQSTSDTAAPIEALPQPEIKKVEIESALHVEKPNESAAKDDIVVTAGMENNPSQEIASTSTAVVEPKTETELKKLELCVDDSTKTPRTTPVLTTPAPETSKKPLQQEDETSKIWKILEEASKSLEPVEIQMDDPAMSKIQPVPIETAIAINVSTTKETKKEAQQLVQLLETKEPIKTKQQSPQPKAAKAKDNGQQTKSANVTKTIDMQPKKGAEPKKKDTKPAPKNVKGNKVVQSTPEKTPDKTLDKTPDKTPEKTPEKTPPIEENKEDSAAVAATAAVAVVANDPIEEIPLDVSIMPSEIEVAELSADSKNVQGSDFAAFAEQSAVEAKSLEPKIEMKVEQPIEIKNKSKSKSPMNLRTENIENASVQIAEQSTAKQNKNSEKTENGSQKPTEPKKLEAIKSESTSKSPSKSVSPEKSKANNNQNAKVNLKNAQGKVTQNNKKSNGKPTVPPKPENLISSQANKSQTSVKSNAVDESKNEKILVLTGHNEDDDSEDDYIEYKFMPRQVFISTICQSCKKPTTSIERVLCQLCQMVSYCCAEHVKNDEPIHKDLCAALQEIAKKRGGHIYNNARILNNNDYRSLRVHTLNLCENFLKRPLQTYEREILLFPRLCLTPTCREWRQNLLTDCPTCGQVFYCTNQPEHLIESHQRWCKSVALYQKLVVTQSMSGRIEPNLPSRIQTKPYSLPNSISDVFKDLYKNYSAIKDECVFATLTQLATAPLTAYYATQISTEQIGEKFTIHLIGAELQFEADVLDIWETFFLHLAHNLMELTIVFCGPELNAENIPLDIISRIRMCRTCRQNCRIVKFDFQCAKFYHDYAMSSAYTKPDLICFFNPGFHHVNSLNGIDTWSPTIKIASSSGCPVVITSYTEYESPRDLERFQSESANGGKQMNLVHGPELNAYASQRPERNFISDEIAPLIFKNYFCFIMK